MKYKFFEFKHSEGHEVVVAESGNQAVNYFTNDYMSDIEEVFHEPGFTVRRLELDEITAKRKIFNEHGNTSENKSYFDVAVESSDLSIPRVIVCPRY